MRILIAEDDAVNRFLLTSILRGGGHELVVTTNGRDALDALAAPLAPPLAILDWMMPGLTGVEVTRRLRASAAERAYIILLTSKSETSEIVEGLASGADDYLVKPFDAEELLARIKVGGRVIELQQKLTERVRELERVILERDRAEAALRQLALTDELTGLYNRRGFFTFAEHYLKLTARTRQHSLLYYVDMDGLKQINDTFGHEEGSRAIRGVADLLRRSFRQTDIIARIGGDEFVVLATNTGRGEKETILARLTENFRAFNADSQLAFELAVSCGVVGVDPNEILPIESLIVEADHRMYDQKRRKKENSQTA